MKKIAVTIEVTLIETEPGSWLVSLWTPGFDRQVMVSEQSVLFSAIKKVALASGFVLDGGNA